MECQPYGSQLREHLREGNKLVELWNKSPNINKFYGKALSEISGGNKTFGYRMMKNLIMTKTGMPFDTYFPYEGKRMYNRIELEILNLDRRLGGRKISEFEKVTFVPRAIANRFPGIRSFLDNINRAVAYERNHNVFYIQQLEKAQKHLQAALFEADAITRTGTGRKQSPNVFLKQVEDVQARIKESIASGDTAKENEMIKSLEDLISRKGGDVLPNVIKYIEGTKEERAEIMNKTSPHVVNAAEAIIDGFMHPKQGLGNVAILGLRKSADVAREIYVGDRKAGPEYERAERFREQVNKTIKSIEDGMEEGRYFPHYLLLELPKIKGKLYDVWDTSNDGAKAAAFESISKIYDQMAMDGRPDHLKGRRGEGLNEVWNQNPIGVFKRYAQDIIAFNKINHVKEAYLKSNHRLQSMEGELAKSMRDYMDDLYKTATIGYTDRDPMVNKITRLLTATEFLSKIGFGFTTSVRNFLSFNYYLANVGYKTWFQSRNAWKTDKILRSKVDSAIKDAGYEFSEANLIAAMEGVVPMEGIERTSIEFDPTKEHLKFKRDGKWETIDKVVAKTTGWGAVFQKITENWMRQEMFRTSFVSTYKMISESPAMAYGHTSEGRERIALRMAKTAGNEAVVSDAFEYGVHAKAPIIGGTYKGYGAVGQIMGQFMHYSMSFMNRQAEHLRGSKDAALAGQWDAPEIKTMARYAGIYAFTHLLSSVINLDLTHVMENDTLDRVKDWITYLKAESDEEREEAFYGRGPVQSVISGPLISDLVFWGNLAGLYSMPDSDWGKMLVGYKDAYEMTDSEKQNRLLGSINVEVARWATKNIPAIANGNSHAIFAYELGLYPRKWTSDMSKAIWGKGGLNIRTKKSKEAKKKIRMQKKARRGEYESAKKRAVMEALKSF